jgi:hypothetical protein
MELVPDLSSITVCSYGAAVGTSKKDFSFHCGKHKFSTHQTEMVDLLYHLRLTDLIPRRDLREDLQTTCCPSMNRSNCDVVKQCLNT